jgi:outer membrane protein
MWVRASTTPGSSTASCFDLDDSWGLAAQVGIDVMLSDRLLLNAQARYIDIDTTGTTHLAGDKVKVDLEVDPFVYMVGLGYRF